MRTKEKQTEHIAMTVTSREKFKSRVTFLRVNPKGKGATEETEVYKDVIAGRVESKIERLTGEEAAWTRVETVKRLREAGYVMVEGMSPIGRGVLMLNRPEDMKAVWGLLSEETRIKELEKEYPHVRLYEILVNPEDWEVISRILEEVGIYNMEAGIES